jgi:hypothetical protein
MKDILIKVAVFVLIIAVAAVLFFSSGAVETKRYVYKGNTEHKVIDIRPGTYQCSECNMDIKDMNYAVQIVTKDGKTYFFDDIGCAVLWLEKDASQVARIFTRTLDTHRWIDAKKAWYSRVDATPMGYGFGAYERKKEGLIPYEEMKLLMLQGKNLHDPFIKKRLLSH